MPPCDQVGCAGRFFIHSFASLFLQGQSDFYDTMKFKLLLNTKHRFINMNIKIKILFVTLLLLAGSFTSVHAVGPQIQGYWDCAQSNGYWSSLYSPEQCVAAVTDAQGCWTDPNFPGNQTTIFRLQTVACPAGYNGQKLQQMNQDLGPVCVKGAWTDIDDTLCVLNQPPIVNAGSNINLTLPTSSTPMSAGSPGPSVSDPGGFVTAVRWTQVGTSPKVATIVSPTSIFSNITNMTTAGTYTFQLEATDNSGAKGYDTRDIIVSNSNTPPTANAGPDKSITLPTSTSAPTGTGATDSGGSVASTVWSVFSSPGGSSPSISSGSTLSPSFSGLSVAGTYVFRLTVTDNLGLTTTDDMSVVVSSAQPDLSAGAPGQTSATQGVPITFGANVANIGGGSTVSSFNNFFQLSTSANGGTPGFSAISANTAGPLAGSGANVVVNSSSYTFNAGTCTANTCSVRLCADNNMSMSGTITEANEANNCSSWANVAITTTPPPPTGLNTTPGSCATGQITLSWNASGGATSYQLYRNGSQIYSGSGLSFLDSGLSTNTTYTYTVRATNAVGSSAQSAGVNGTAPGSCPVNPPTNFAMSASCAYDLANLTWSHPAGWVPSGSNYFKVYRNGSQVSTAPDTLVGTGTSYGLWYPQAGTYHLTAVYTSGQESSGSNSVVFDRNTDCGFGSDLTAGSTTPNSATAGTPLTFSSTLSNVDSYPTPSSFPYFFQVNNGSSGAGGTTTDLASATTAVLNAFSNRSVSSPSYTFPSGGNWSVRACADKTNNASAGTIAETNEGNNCSPWTNVTVSAAAQPNLSASAPTPSTATAGTGLTFSSTISNTGSASTGASFSNFFQVNNGSGGAGGSTTDLTSSSMAALSNVAGSNTASATSPSYTFASAGAWSVRACADKTNSASAGSISESNEADNCSSWTNVTVAAAGMPDLTPGAITPTTATAGVPVTFTVTVSNIGNATTGASFNNLFRLATAANGGGTVTTHSVNSLATLAAGASAPVSSNPYTFPSAGTYSVRFATDQNASWVGTIAESDETSASNYTPWTNITVSASATAPTVTTTSPVTNITSSSATGGGNITSNGGSTVTVSGLVWSTAPNPTTALSTKTTDGWAIGGPWTSNMTTLSGNTLYYVRAYATNGVGTSYGAPVTFSTSSGVVMSGDLSGPSCTITAGNSSCTTTLTWTVNNPEVPGGTQITSPYPTAGTVVTPPVSTGSADSGTKTGVTIPYGGRDFYLYNNGVPVDSEVGTITADCAAGTAWDSTDLRCETVVFPPSIDLFDSDPDNPVPLAEATGTGVTITWDADADDCTSNFGGSGISGSVVVYPATPGITTYTLQCTRNSQVANGTLNVVVGDAPTRKPIFIED